jgi:16S rRNA (cytosine967-C5)-methyltransferase
MHDSGRISAAIDIVAEIEDRRRPAKLALKDWGTAHRFAGAKDRAWISGLVLDTLRHRRSLAWRIGVDGPRARVLACLRFSWGWEIERVAAAAAEEPHGTGPLYDDERAGLASPRSLDDAPAPVAGDYPDWLEPAMTRAFGDARVAEGHALSERAPVDLRVNTLKTDAERALRALAAGGAHPQAEQILTTAIRLPPQPPAARGEAVESIPAYSKGWVEVQDLGSQIAAAAAGDIRGAQVLDYCAGGGGKTLAMAAAMGNTGQIYAYDADARRLAPIFARAQRAGVRNLQVRSPKDRPVEGAGVLDELRGKMDVVFVDAPCTGSGVWRRQPDAKWRLRAGQIERRMGEQDAALATAAEYVKPGGRIVYVTCSLFTEENEDRIAAFLAGRPEFEQRSAAEAAAASGLASEAGLARLHALETPEGALRLTPRRAGTDGFFVSSLRKASSP